jgi:hypothetical protein
MGPHGEKGAMIPSKAAFLGLFLRAKGLKCPVGIADAMVEV